MSKLKSLRLETAAARNRRLFGTDNPVAFVTGSAAPRVGRCVLERLMAEGFRPIFHSHRDASQAREIAEEATALGHQSGWVVGDVGEEQIVAGWLETIMSQFGRCDLLVNSASIWNPQVLERTSQGDFEAHFRANALGTALCCQHFGLAMTKQPMGGSIVNIGDWASRRPYQDFAAYFLSKASIEGVTKSMAVELASRNPRVRVNAILPGPVQLADGIDAQKRELIIAECLLKREGTATDVAQTVLFLASSPFVTGACIPVDGGRTIYAGPTADTMAHPNHDPGG
ncbi:MAG: SDR family oxidoreductase [Planctomycetales bacterium]|nr:SDR family oxidoreductase [Planctomycetales bacterium]